MANLTVTCASRRLVSVLNPLRRSSRCPSIVAGVHYQHTSSVVPIGRENATTTNNALDANVNADGHTGRHQSRRAEREYRDALVLGFIQLMDVLVRVPAPYRSFDDSSRISRPKALFEAVHVIE
jgi:hypothetical protein